LTFKAIFKDTKLMDKKVLLGVGGFIFLVVVIVVYILTQNKPSSVTNNSAAIPQNSVGQNNSNNTKQSTTSRSDYKNDLFSVQIPPKFAYQTSLVQGGGKAIDITDQSKDGFGLAIHIEAGVALADSSLAKQEGVYKGLGFQKSSRIIDSINFTQFSGKIPDVLAQNYSPPRRDYETFLLFETAGRRYAISYKYSGSSINQNLENKVSEVLETVHFTGKNPGQ
jgi:hypothetical protein